MRPDFPLDGATRDFLKRSGVRPGAGLVLSVEKFLEANLLIPGQFVVLHIRLGDGFRDTGNATDLLVKAVEACLDEVRHTQGDTSDCGDGRFSR